jgi:hypothetical protein
VLIRGFSVGFIAFDRSEIKGFVDRKPLIGKLDVEFRDPVAVRNADYRFDEFSDLNGRFKGRIQRGGVWIKYEDSEATITGTIDEWDLELDFEGKTEVL